MGHRCSLSPVGTQESFILSSDFLWLGLEACCHNSAIPGDGDIPGSSFRPTPLRILFSPTLDTAFPHAHALVIDCYLHKLIMILRNMYNTIPRGMRRVGHHFLNFLNVTYTTLRYDIKGTINYFTWLLSGVTVVANCVSEDLGAAVSFAWLTLIMYLLYRCICARRG